MKIGGPGGIQRPHPRDQRIRRRLSFCCEPWYLACVRSSGRRAATTPATAATSGVRSRTQQPALLINRGWNVLELVMTSSRFSLVTSWLSHKTSETACAPRLGRHKSVFFLLGCSFLRPSPLHVNAAQHSELEPLRMADHSQLRVRNSDKQEQSHQSHRRLLTVTPSEVSANKKIKTSIASNFASNKTAEDDNDNGAREDSFRVLFGVAPTRAANTLVIKQSAHHDDEANSSIRSQVKGSRLLRKVRVIRAPDVNGACANHVSALRVYEMLTDR